MGKEVKTNAMRILDKNKIPYEILINNINTKYGSPIVNKITLRSTVLP